jgi:hypothetical protein
LLKSVYVETDLEKEIYDIINSEEAVYNMSCNMKGVKHKILTESEGLNSRNLLLKKFYQKHFLLL